MVVEPSLDSLEVAEVIHELAGQIDIADVWAVLNKITSEKITQLLVDYLNERDIRVNGQVHQNNVRQPAKHSLKSLTLPLRHSLYLDYDGLHS